MKLALLAVGVLFDCLAQARADAGTIDGGGGAGHRKCGEVSVEVGGPIQKGLERTLLESPQVLGSTCQPQDEENWKRAGDGEPNE